MGLRESNSPTAALEGGRGMDGGRELVEIWERHGNWEKTWENEG